MIPCWEKYSPADTTTPAFLPQILRWSISWFQWQIRGERVAGLDRRRRRSGSGNSFIIWPDQSPVSQWWNGVRKYAEWRDWRSAEGKDGNERENNWPRGNLSGTLRVGHFLAAAAPPVILSQYSSAWYLSLESPPHTSHLTPHTMAQAWQSP